MVDPERLAGWPEGSTFALTTLSGEILLASGDPSEVRSWASVTKLAVAYGIAVAVARGEAAPDEPLGPSGSTLAHLLAHASGLGYEATDPTVPAGTRRIYSNVGVEVALRSVIGSRDPSTWMFDEVFAPLRMSTSTLNGRASAGARGSLADLLRLGRAWADGDELPGAVREVFTEPYLPELAGIVPGFGRFTPCPWGLGPEVHGDKEHWMGTIASTRAYGHFGRSGSFLLVDPDRGLVVAALAARPFGTWAVKAWPTWMDALFDRFGA